MLASVDVGSNTIRLLLGSVDNGKVVPYEYFRQITRLKGGQTDAGLSPEAMDRSLLVLKQFSTVISQYNPDSVRVVGTAALRTALNSQEFTARVLAETQLNIEIIAGEEEASLTAKGVCSAIDTLSTDTVLIFDIGGGSTEFVLIHLGVILFQQSLSLGVVDLVETYANGASRYDSIHSIVTKLSSSMDQVLQRHSISRPDICLVGTAGTVTTLAAINMQMDAYDWRRVNGYCLDIRSIERMQYRLSQLTCLDRESLPGMEEGRGDLIPAGIEITLEIMRQFQSESLTISDFGLLEGILLSLSSISGSKR